MTSPHSCTQKTDFLFSLLNVMKNGSKYPFIPQGNYLFSSAHISVVLYCHSLNSQREWVPAHFNLTTSEKVNLANRDGKLVNLDGTAISTGFVPGGPYLDSSREVRVFLTALCTCRNLALNWSSLELTHLPMNLTVVNKNGILRIK